MMEGGKNTRMCQQLQLPGAEIVKPSHGKRANAQTKPHSILPLLVDSLKGHWGHKIKKKPSLHLAPGRSCKTTVRRLAGSNSHRNCPSSDVWILRGLTQIFTLCRPAACTCPLLHSLQISSLFCQYCFLHSPSPQNGVSSRHK